MSNLINIYSLRRKTSQREAQRLEIYQSVLHRCHRRIEMVAQGNKDETNLLFTIPPMILGMPAYDIASCGEYIIHHLTMNGFRVVSISPNQLFVSWGHIQFDAAKEKALDEKIQDLCFVESGQLYHRLTDNRDTPPESKPKVTFRPLYDTPSTEKFLMN